MINKSVEFLNGIKVGGFENLRVIKSKRQASNLRKILIKAEFSQKQLAVYKCPEKRCECCASLLLGNSYTFEKNDQTFNLRTYFFWQ